MNTSWGRMTPSRRRAAKAASCAAILCSLLLVASAASANNPPTSSAARSAFGQLLHQRFGDVQGYWACPSASSVVGAKIDCLAEVRSSKTWHQTSALASLTDGHVVISHVVDTAWLRHWWPYSRHFILRSNEPQVPGLVSVNSPVYDWGFLAECAEGVNGRVKRCNAYDGDSGGLVRLFRFTCSRRAGLVTCTNALGDSMRYRRA